MFDLGPGGRLPRLRRVHAATPRPADAGMPARDGPPAFGGWPSLRIDGVRPYYADPFARVYHARAEDVMPRVNAAAVDLVATDPPYGIGYRPGGHGEGAVRRRAEVVAGDDRPFDPSPLLRFPRVILWGAAHYAHLLPPSRSWLVWDKREGSAPDNHGDCDLAWSNLGCVVRAHSQLWRGMVRRGEREPRLHPTQKSVAVMAWCVALSGTPHGGLVADFYMGSGTTLVAARSMGCAALGVDADERYCEAAANRLRQGYLSDEWAAAGKAGGR